MRIRLIIDKDWAHTAIAYSLSMGDIINSKKAFIKCVESYVWQYGRLALDDHDGECYPYNSQADLIIDKYYPQPPTK